VNEPGVSRDPREAPNGELRTGRGDDKLQRRIDSEGCDTRARAVSARKDLRKS